MNAEDLLRDQHDRERPIALRPREIGRQVTAGDADLRVAGNDPVVSVLIAWACTTVVARVNPLIRLPMTNPRRATEVVRASASSDPVIL